MAKNLFKYGIVFISVRAKGAGGAAAPPEKNFSGKTPQIYVIKKQFSGKIFGQTGLQPPQVGKLFRAKKAQNSGKMAGRKFVDIMKKIGEKIFLVTFFFFRKEIFLATFFFFRKENFFGDVFF